MTGLATYSPAVVATQQWYVGPGQQGDARGRDTTRSTRTVSSREIEWPTDGYRLFDIGHFVGDRDWFDGIWESNCLFVPRRSARAARRLRRELLGGRRRVRQPRLLRATRLVTRRHGRDHHRRGVVPPGPRRHDDERGRHRQRSRRSPATRAVRGDARATVPRSGPARCTSSGACRPVLARTKARRGCAPTSSRPASPDPDGLPEQPSPIPEELRTAFVDAFWRSHAWRDDDLAGPAGRATPADRPARRPGADHASVPTGSSRPGPGGAAGRCSSRRSASSSGTGGALDRRAAGRRPSRAPAGHVSHRATRPTQDTAAQVRERSGEPPNALVVLGSRGAKRRMVTEFPVLAARTVGLLRRGRGDDRLTGTRCGRASGRARRRPSQHVLGTRERLRSTPRWSGTGLTFNPCGFLKRLQVRASGDASEHQRDLAVRVGGRREEPGLDRVALAVIVGIGSGAVQEEVVEQQHVAGFEHWPAGPGRSGDRSIEAGPDRPGEDRAVGAGLEDAVEALRARCRGRARRARSGTAPSRRSRSGCRRRGTRRPGASSAFRGRSPTRRSVHLFTESTGRSPKYALIAPASPTASSVVDELRMSTRGESAVQTPPESRTHVRSTPTVYSVRGEGPNHGVGLLGGSRPRRGRRTPPWRGRCPRPVARTCSLGHEPAYVEAPVPEDPGADRPRE